MQSTVVCPPGSHDAVSWDNISSSIRTQINFPLGLYLYRPLKVNEIRVIKLLAGEPSDDITFDIHHVPLQDPLDCDALSYTWGDSANTKYVSCSNEEGMLHVTSNCFSALRRLRLPDRHRKVWIDAICIDQNNPEERNAQVAIMAQVYNFANEVVIYLGEASEDSDLAINQLKRLAYGDGSPGLDFEQREVDAVRALLSRPWFSRVWVIQEVRNAKSALVICGNSTCLWDRFLNLRGRFGFPTTALGPTPYVIRPPNDAWRRNKGDIFSPSKLFEVLCQARACSSTDPRDKVFALMPLFTDIFSATNYDIRLSLDYRRLTRDVFIDVAKFLVEKIGWQVLYAVEGGSTIMGLPSWCPDWSVKPATQHLYSHHKLPLIHTYHAHSDHNLEILMCKKDHWDSYSLGSNYNQIHGKKPKVEVFNTLRAWGVRYDVVARTGKVCDISDPNWTDIVFNEWRTFSQIPVKKDQIMSSKVVDGHPSDSSNKSDFHHLHGFFLFLSQSSPLAEKVVEDDAFRNACMHPKKGKRQTPERRLHDRIKGRCQGQLIFNSSRHGLGLASAHAMVGDIIVFMDEATVPFLLRGREDGKYVIIGKCSIHSLDSFTPTKGSYAALEEFLIA